MRIDPIVRATKLYETGLVDKAIEALQSLPADDPAYQESRALIDQWQAQIAVEEPAVDTGPSPELLERRNLLLAAARKFQGERRFLRARKYFERAHEILPLESEDMALKLNCDAELRPLADEVRKFQERDYAVILRGLWQKRDEEPGNLDVERLIVDSYYNLALLDLQRGDAGEAAAKLREALGVDPEDQDAQRLQLFAETYVKKSQDLLYKIFIKHLPERDL
jgi:tetratricopeptide (TPR) repeat protein